MPDQKGLKYLGLLFASLTLAVMLATVMVVKSNADGSFSFETMTTDYEAR